MQHNNNPPFLVPGVGVPLIGGGSGPTIVIQAVLTDEERTRLLSALREIVREELQAHHPIPQDVYICELCGHEKGLEE